MLTILSVSAVVDRARGEMMTKLPDTLVVILLSVMFGAVVGAIVYTSMVCFG